MEEERKEMERLKEKLFQSETRAKHLENILEAKDKDLGRLREVRHSLLFYYSTNTKWFSGS